MPYTPIDTTTGAGDTAQAGGNKINAMLSELYARLDNVPAPKNNRIAIIGPSHAANHFNTGSTTGLPSSFNASAMGPVHWANFLSGGRATLDSENCQGWNGDRSGADAGYPGALSRVDAVIASGVGTVVLVAVTANDRNTMTAQASIDNLKIMIDKFVAAGLVVVILPDYPHGSTAGNTYILSTEQQAYWDTVNSWTLKQQTRGVYVIDTAAILRDHSAIDGRGLSSMYVEGLHLNQQGAYAIGRAMAPLWRKIFPAFVGYPASNHSGAAGSVVAGLDTRNAYLNITSGAAAGTLPAAWSSPMGSGLTATFTKKTTTSFNGRSYAEDDGGPVSKDWLEFVVTGTATAAAEVIMLRQDYDVAMTVPHRAMAEIEIDSGHTGVNIINLNCWQSGNSVQARGFASPGTNQSTLLPVGAHRGILRTPLFTMPGTANRLQLQVLPINGATVSITVRVRAIACGTDL